MELNKRAAQNFGPVPATDIASIVDSTLWKLQSLKQRLSYQEKLDLLSQKERTFIMEVESDASCPICFQDYVSPVECARCRQLFCHGCLTSWRTRQGKDILCPFCNQKFQGRIPSKTALVKYFCPRNCSLQQQLEGKQVLNHMIGDCDKQIITCPLKCFEEAEMPLSDLKDHLKCCFNMKVQCQSCHEKVKYHQTEVHSCVSSLRKQLKDEQKIQISNCLKIAQMNMKKKQLRLVRKQLHELKQEEMNCFVCRQIIKNVGFQVVANSTQKKTVCAQCSPLLDDIVQK